MAAAIAARRRRAQIVRAGRHALGRRERHDDALRFVFATKAKTLGGHRRPAAGRRDLRARRRRGGARAVRHRDGEASRRPPRSVDRPEDFLRRDGDIQVTRHEQRPPDLADRLVAIAIHDFARQRHRLARDDQPYPRGDGRRLEWQAAHVRGHPGPIVETTAVGERPPQEVGLRALRVARHGDHESAAAHRAGRDG